MARARTGLADDELATAVAAVADGKRPRVALPAQQFGGATTGTIVAIGDPAVDGDEFISVRVKLDGITDTVRFGPAELTVPTRASRTPAAVKKVMSSAAATSADAATSAAAAMPAGAAVPAGAAPPAGAAMPVGAAPQAVAATPTTTPPRKRPSPRPKSTPVTPAPLTSAAAAPTREAVSRAAGAPRAATSGNRKPAGRKPPSAVTFTVSSSGTAWTLTANRGGRALVRTTPVPAGVVTAVAELLAETALRDAVEDVNGSALREAEERAEQLRRELAAVESLLESHRRPG